ncbi:TIGR02996 domain-containing protein [Urbifossiella limnaea]|uniref:Leucine Rich repeats (2 copies) n=1 Tax=Urbifossiella limnaea TaxID=2528023 RepID=A0A517XS67_9BACT|nr:TIGR02996 domain-containing protein [Urbifossiella limnaea]QDU20354.1 Leucine Rich repeats (2 copies) [Urbifossiella limnaea]
MSPDELPFLDAILARPGDDAPRLVYADFLADTGTPADAARADLIRVQLALARMPDDHPRRPALKDQQTDLLARHQAAWTEPLRGLVGGVEFRRGLPDSVSVDAGVFAARGEELIARTRTPSGRSYLRRVHLLDPARVLPRLLACPALAQLEEISFAGGELGNAGAEQLARGPRLPRLRGLDLSFNGLDDTGVRGLARSPVFAGLQRLSLNDNGQVTWDGVTALADSPHLQGLTDLDLGGNDVNDAGVRALVASCTLARLSALRLAGNHVGDGGAAALAGSDLFRRMLARDGRVDFRANAVGPAGAEALAACPDLLKATAIDLDKNYLGDRGAAVLVASSGAARLKRLRLSRNQITDAGAFVLADAVARGLPGLQAIDVSGNRLTWRGVNAVRDAAVARGVIPDVTGNPVDGSGPMAALDHDAPNPDAGNVDELRRRVAFPARRER